MWSNIEVNVGIMCASIQTIRPMFGRCFPKFFVFTLDDENNPNKVVKADFSPSDEPMLRAPSKVVTIPGRHSIAGLEMGGGGFEKVGAASRAEAVVVR